MKHQTPRRNSHQAVQSRNRDPRKFNYDLDYKNLDLRENPELYRVGVGEQGVLLVEPYKSEILKHWRFANPQVAYRSAVKIFRLFARYKNENDFLGMDMARKFLQMGFTRSRRYANHASGRKYDKDQKVLPPQPDSEKAASADIFFKYWKEAESDEIYAIMRQLWKLAFG